MLLRQLTIKNFKQLKEVVIDDLSKINTFIGRNNSGKSSILEAIRLLFTNEKIDNSVFHNGNGNEIVIDAVIQLEERDINKHISSNLEEPHKTLILESAYTLIRKTVQKDGKAELKVLKDIGYNRVLDKLKEDKIKNKEKIDLMHGIIRSKYLGNIQRVTKKLIQDLSPHLAFIDSNRHVNSEDFRPFKKTGVAKRNKYFNLRNNTQPKIRREYSKRIESLSSLDASFGKLEAVEGNQLLVPVHEDFEIDISKKGSGNQDAFLLSDEFDEDSSIICLDEPENSKHISLQEKIFERIQEKEKQVFIATHSPVFLEDSKTIRSFLVVCNLENNQASVQRIASKKELELLRTELGTTSKYNLKTKLYLFTEGRTEELAIPKLLDKKVDYWGTKCVEIINLESVSKIKYEYLKYHLASLRELGIPFFILCDRENNVEDEIEKLKRDSSISLLDDSVHIWTKSFEEIFPDKILIDATMTILIRESLIKSEEKDEKQGLIEREFEAKKSEASSTKNRLDILHQIIYDLFKFQLKEYKPDFGLLLVDATDTNCPEEINQFLTKFNAKINQTN